MRLGMRMRKSIPMTFTLAVLEDESPLLLVAVHVYPPASPLLTDVNTRDPLGKTERRPPLLSSFSPLDQAILSSGYPEAGQIM